MLAVDANFRLKNRIRKNENRASALGEGLGYFVATEPYKHHISGYVKESDVSSETTVILMSAHGHTRSAPASLLRR